MLGTRNAAVTIGVALVAIVGAPTATVGARTRAASDDITPSMVAAAIVQPSDLTGVLAGDQYAKQWTPGDLQVYTADAARSPAFKSLPGLQVTAARNYYGSTPDAAGRIVPQTESVVSLFGTEEDAKHAFDLVTNTLEYPRGDKDGTTVDGPAVGDESRYYNRLRTDTTVTDSSVRFRMGRALARVSLLGEPRYGDQAPATADPETVHYWAEPVATHLEKMFVGTIIPVSVPKDDVSFLPAAKLAPGPQVFEAVERISSWALPGDPQVSRAISMGGDVFLQREYGLKGNPPAELSVAVITFDGPAQAKKWQKDFGRTVAQKGWKKLAPGKAGSGAAFGKRTKNTDGNAYAYELQFAAGAHAADVSCGALSGKPPAQCEAAVRKLAAGWYKQLSR